MIPCFRCIWCSLLSMGLSAWTPLVCVSPALLFFRVAESLRRVSGSLVRVICHLVSCSDLGLFVCVFVLIIMGCSLLLSHFLFIVLILAPGSSLTSQGCLWCGNQGKLYLTGVWSHLFTSDLLQVSKSYVWYQSVAGGERERKCTFSRKNLRCVVTCARLITLQYNIGSKHLSASFIMDRKTLTNTKLVCFLFITHTFLTPVAKWQHVSVLNHFGTFYFLWGCPKATYLTCRNPVQTLSVSSDCNPLINLLYNI